MKKIFGILLALALVLSFSLVTAVPATSPNWWNTDWIYRMKLTFDNSASSGNLSGFPVLVHLTSAQSGFWDNINSGITTNDTKDLRFVDDDDSTELYFEAENIDYASEDAVIWVKVPQIDAGSTTDFIYLYYGNPGATESTYHSANEVWDSNFKGVWHMTEVDAIDSTSNDNDGTQSGGVTQNPNGKIDGADDFDGSNDLVNCGNDTSLRITSGAITVEMWLWRNDMVNALALDKDYASSYYFYFKSNGAFELGSSVAGDFWELESDPGELSTDTWYYLAGTFSGTTDTAVLYKNGAEVKKATNETGYIGTNNVDLAIGAYYGGDYWFNGIIDEVRISDIARSADWIKASYISGNDSLLSYGEEETLTPPTVTTKAASNIGTTSATLNMGYTVGHFSPVQVRFAWKKATATVWFYTDWVSKSGSGTYAGPRTGLDSNTNYDFKAQLKYNDTVIEGTTLQFTTDKSSTSPPSGCGCFIATAAYGTPTAEQIDVLREFRDVVLLESTVGSQFVALYYQVSPPIADFIASNELLRTLVRELLVDPIVWVVEATGDMWRN